MARVVRGTVGAKADLPSLSEVVSSPFISDTRRLPLHNQLASTPQFVSDLPRTPAVLDASTKTDQHQRRIPEHPSEHVSRPSEHGLSSMALEAESRHHSSYEQSMTGTGLSPHPSSASSVFAPAQSSMQSQPSSRTLPSPPSGPYPPASGFMSAQYSAEVISPAHASHLHDLQHQISTKSLALQTLQREHDQLLAAFSRSQVRCTALDKKSQVSDHEINTLTMDKVRLGQEVEQLETQVAELTRARNEVHQQSTADGAQWRQIMAMSSQLQAKGIEEARKFREEREAWEKERAAFRERVERLESGRELSATNEAASGSTTPVANDSVLTSDSIEALRTEVIKSRRRCAELELRLHELAGETEKLGRVIDTLESVRQNLSAKQKDAEGR